MKKRLKAHREALRGRWGAVVTCIADLLGPNAEVVLHDATDPTHSVADIRHGHVTGRVLGAPLTDLGYFMLRESQRRIETLGVYYSRTASGRLLKCNAANLRDDRGEIEGILCINLDITDSPHDAWPQGPAAATAPVLNENYQAKIEHIIQRVMAEAIGDNAGPLTTDQNLRVVRKLDAAGVFLARGAVRKVADQLGVATPTVYKYLSLARKGGVLTAGPAASTRRRRDVHRPAKNPSGVARVARATRR